MCDESNKYNQVKAQSHDIWCVIREKIRNKTLTVANIEDTLLKGLYFLCDLDGADLFNAYSPPLSLL